MSSTTSSTYFAAKNAPTAPAGTVLGAGLTIEGEISGSDPVSVAGVVRGSIKSSEPVSIEVGATVEADLEVKALRNAGTVLGSVAATERIDMLPDSRLIGDVRAPRVSIAEGAAFKGRIDMEVG
jgi:cytoskeletal protein CcmA (bactofilin family)